MNKAPMNAYKHPMRYSQIAREIKKFCVHRSEFLKLVKRVDKLQKTLDKLSRIHRA